MWRMRQNTPFHTFQRAQSCSVISVVMLSEAAPNNRHKGTPMLVATASVNVISTPSLIEANSCPGRMSKTKPRVIDGLSFSKLVSGKNIGASPHPTQPSLKSILIATFSTLSSLDEAIVEVLQAICAVHLHRDDWEGHGHVTHIVKGKYGVSVAADESCYSCLVDAKRIITGNLADFINIKLAKVGIVGGLEIIEEARTSGLDPMIGGMVETRLAMGFTGHLAAGFGCFKTGPNTGKENRIDRSSLVFSFS